MKKITVKTLLCVTLILSLTGCGIQDTVEDRASKELTQTKAIDKEIVIAENPTGSAIITESEPVKVIPSVYPNKCTEDCLYIGDGMDIVQCDLDGKELQRFEMPGVDEKNKDEEIESLYVADGEILYEVFCDDNKSSKYGFYSQLCSVPIKRDENGEQLLVEQTEKVLRQVADGMWLLYADKEIVSYSPGLEGEIRYCEYDRVHQKQIPINAGDSDEYYVLPLGKYGSWGGDYFQTVLLAKRGKGETPEDTEDQGIYVHKAGSQEIQKVATHYIDRYSGGMYIATTEDRVYYTCLHDSYTDKYGNTDEYSFDIWCYDTITGENTVLVTEEEIKQTEPNFTYIFDIFADGNSLYVYGYTEKEEDTTYFVLCISQDADGKWKVEPEKELSRILNSDKEDGYEVRSIIGGRCYYEIEVKEDGHYVDKYYVFDLLSKESKEVKKNDPEYYYWEFTDEDE